jgi:hypothetical protein
MNPAADYLRAVARGDYDHDALNVPAPAPFVAAYEFDFGAFVVRWPSCGTAAELRREWDEFLQYLKAELSE